MQRLTFRELETLSRAGLPGFFSLFHARIAPKQSIGLERAAQIVIHLQKGARDRQPRRAGLSGRAATGGVDRQVVSVYQFRRLQWLEYRVLQRRGREIIFKATAVDVDLAAAWRHANAGHGRFVAPGGDEFLRLPHKETTVAKPSLVFARRADANRLGKLSTFDRPRDRADCAESSRVRPARSAIPDAAHAAPERFPICDRRHIPRSSCNFSALPFCHSIALCQR